MKLITRRPMDKTDWAWIMAAVLFGLVFATLGILSENTYSDTRVVTTYNDATGQWEDSVKPSYKRRLTIETNGDIQKMIYAVEDIDHDSRCVPSVNYHKLTANDYFGTLFSCVFGMMMISLLFRIVLKICLRILGVKQQITVEIPQ